MVVDSMASQGVEPTFCMGDTIPLALLSSRPHLMYDYIKQRFAQVTNPPIDPIREGLVMSLQMRLGARGNLLDPAPYHQLFLSSPVLLESEMEFIKQDNQLGSQELKLFYDGKIKLIFFTLFRRYCSIDIQGLFSYTATYYL